ncbi:hypothetical protein V7S43_002116 [Phytophthora oleae]|uniref:RxLR effector protein n=1 Tax=Phytophthora oleae TaxID=2107226 RepID=A0ABD3G0Z5_9STRA
MKFYHIVLLVVALVVACADPASASKDSKLTPHGNNTPSKRLLRAYTTDVEEEERGISVNLAGLDKIKNALTSSKTKELQKLVKAGESADDSFMKLGLGKVLNFEKGAEVRTKMVSKFLSSDKFKAWSKYATKLNQKDADRTMIAALTSAYGEKNTAVIILLGKDSRSSRTVAKRLETAQFNKWYITDKLRNADELVTKVLKVPRSRIRGHPREMYIWDNYSKFISNIVLHPRPGPVGM